MNYHKRNKLLIIRGSSQYIDIDNYNVQEIGLGKILVDRNWDVTIYTSGEKADTRILNEHLRWIQTERYLGKYGWPKNIRKFLLDSNPDIIQCQDLSNFASVIPFITKGIKTPIVLSLGEYSPKSKLTSIFNKVMSLMIRRRTKAVLCKTVESMKYAEKLGFTNIQYAPVGIDSEKFNLNNSNDILNQKIEMIKHDIDDGKRILCHIGRLDKEDNHFFLEQVMEQLSENYRLVLVGSPVPDVNEKDDKIYYFGKIPNHNIGQILDHSDLYLSCSSYEPFGLSAVESIYNGCPVLGYATGGLYETVEDNVNGILTDIRDPKTWAELIECLFDTTKIEQLKQGCMNSKEKITWNSRANKYHDSYATTINAHTLQTS